MIKLILIGNLTGDPEVRTVQTANGDRFVANFTLAMNGRNEGDTTFIRISVWEKLAENCAKYLAKGRKACCVCNSISARTYEAKDGTNRIALEATANEVEFLSSAKEQGEEKSGQDQQYRSSQTKQQQAPVQQGFTPVDFSNDELPF